MSSRCTCRHLIISQHLSYCLRRTNLRGLWLEILRLLSMLLLLPENPSQNVVCSFQGPIPVSFEVYFLLRLVNTQDLVSRYLLRLHIPLGVAVSVSLSN